MSAPITAQHTGRIRYHIEPYEFDADAPRYRGTPVPGHLWERVAERNRPNYDVYPWKVLDAVEHFHSSAGRPVCIAATGYKGILGRHVCGDHHSHGIIRAGKRIK